MNGPIYLMRTCCPRLSAIPRHIPGAPLILLLLTLGMLAQGCVSTEELYAQYDEQACRVGLVETPSGATVVRELATDRTMTWEPAVHFALERAELSGPEKRRLDRDLAVLIRYPELRVSLRGYADASGKTEFNRDLSVRRVESVMSYLAAGGLARSRMEKVALGENLPLVDTETEAAVPFNRRVELLLMDVNGNLVPYDVGASDVDALLREQ